MSAVPLRRWFLSLGCACLVAGPAGAQQAYPSKPVQIVVPFGPAGSVDITVRIIAPSLQARLGEPVVILNRPGGGTTIGMNVVAAAAPDGHTLGAASFAFAVNPYVLERLPYDTLKDFEPVTMVARSAAVMVVNPSLPVKTVTEFISYAAARPGELNYGSVGVASSGHLITSLFETLTGIKMTHVPFTGSSPLPPLVAGQIQLQFSPIPTALPFIRSGKLVALGVTSLQRDPTLPEVPPIAETVKGFEAYEWPSLVAPAGTPREIINRLHQEVVKVLAEPDVKTRLLAAGSIPAGMPPQEFGAFIRKEMAAWEKVARGIREGEKGR